MGKSSGGKPVKPQKPSPTKEAPEKVLVRT